MRYSLGRQTYMPGLIQDLMKRHRDVLSAQDCDQLGREIDEYHGRFGKIGADFDTRDWILFRDWLFARRDELTLAEAIGTPVPTGDPPATNLTETVLKYARTPDTNDCVKFYRSEDGEPEGVFCFINGVGGKSKTAEDALRNARAAWDELRSESVLKTSS
jgi:hypothetical protein